MPRSATAKNLLGARFVNVDLESDTAQSTPTQSMADGIYFPLGPRARNPTRPKLGPEIRFSGPSIASSDSSNSNSDEIAFPTPTHKHQLKSEKEPITSASFRRTFSEKGQY